METKLFNQAGKELGNVELNDAVFGVEVNEGLIHRALVYQLSNARVSTAHTKTRAERRGSTRKIYRQKGTGRARMGSNRSPVRKKGGVAFGPRNTENYTISMNKKERRKAIFCALSSKLATGNLMIIDAIKMKETKTKEMQTVLDKLKLEKVLFAIPEKDTLKQKATSNLKTAKMIQVDYLNMADLLKYKTLVLEKASLDKIDSLFVK